MSKSVLGLCDTAHPEDVRCCPFVGGFQGYEGDAVIQRRVAQHTRPENGVFWDVARRVDAGENVRQTLLDRFGVSIPHQLLRAGLLHFTLRTRRKHVRCQGKREINRNLCKLVV